ncbi:unnamed protein product [Sphenostylis stenocarpa]|uniref:Uncharacterized protein n=1 Tax=Sphenostylis stenocarpa TaxID=92480 RepID=A0AA86V983_9FABA|nr:unnamed protein product [Sphenostylis stenocarpa]
MVVKSETWPDATSEKVVPSTAPSELEFLAFGCNVALNARRGRSPERIRILDEEDAEASYTAAYCGFRRRSEFSDLRIWSVEQELWAYEI